MLTLNDGRSELWQWDTGRTLAVDADCSQVHFSNKVFGRSIDVDVVDGTAIIPDVLLQTDKDLNVWAFVGTAENGYTKISKTFKVNRRNKPADYVFTPTEQTTLAKLVEQIGNLDELTTEAKDNLVAAINEAAKSGGSGEGGTTDHTKLTNRDAENQHPMSAITGLLGALGGKVSVADIINNLTTNASNKPLSAAQGVALKALIDAISIPEKLPNPHALTFTGAVTGSYDGSEAKTVNIPSGGGDVWEFGGTIPLDLITPTARYEFAPCSIWKKVQIVRVRQSYNKDLSSNVWYGASNCENSEGNKKEIRLLYTNSGYVYNYAEMMVDNDGGAIGIKAESNNTNISTALNISYYSNNRVISNIPVTYNPRNVTEDSNWFIQAVDPSTAWDGSETYYWWGVRS